MTRFARAKGSKASNERLPESATCWSEMKQELLNKNKEIDEKKNREKAMQQRQANYQAFLQEKEDEDVRNVSWADFPEARNGITEQKTQSKMAKNSAKKRKTSEGHNDRKEVKTSKNKKVKVETIEQNEDSKSIESDEEFSALKSQIDKVLDEQKALDSDSDAPPEEASTRERPKEIIIKKTKKPKKKLQILLNHKDKFEKKPQNIQKQMVLHGNVRESEQQKKVPKIENLTEQEKKKIEKKQERYKKQLEKKKVTRNENKLNNKFKKPDGETSNDFNGPVTEKEASSENSSEIDARRVEKKLERRKRQKEKKLKNKLDKESTLEDKKKDEVLTEKDLAKIQKKKERRARQAEKRKKLREAKALAAENGETKQELDNNEALNENDGNNNFNNPRVNIHNNDKFKDKTKQNVGNTALIESKPFQQNLSNQKEKKAKLKEKKDFQNRKAKPETMFINGKSIEIDYVDGFPVKKEDADRLKKLRREMITKGLPRSEINISLKLERRRAEKALTREKKNVCFNCRKSGHNLSECPELNKDQVIQTSGTGICFKCGSTEHTHFDCKVVKGLDYKFATCFICKEQGHISRQCPDNQRGLYPKGGACKVCGDVTHLKKDCPKHQAQQAHLESSLSIDTLDNRNPDDLGSKGDFKNTLGPVKKLNKIKF